MSTLAVQLTDFYEKLAIRVPLPPGVSVLHPQQHEEVLKVTGTFFRKYYNDNHPRQLILGINPGRFGAGVTGINFTAPRQLKEYCGIDHPFGDSSELSAEFIEKQYEIIQAYNKMGITPTFSEGRLHQLE